MNASACALGGAGEDHLIVDDRGDVRSHSGVDLIGDAVFAHESSRGKGNGIGGSIHGKVELVIVGRDRGDRRRGVIRAGNAGGGGIPTRKVHGDRVGVRGPTVQGNLECIGAHCGSGVVIRGAGERIVVDRPIRPGDKRAET